MSTSLATLPLSATDKMCKRPTTPRQTTSIVHFIQFQKISSKIQLTTVAVQRPVACTGTLSTGTCRFRWIMRPKAVYPHVDSTALQITSAFLLVIGLATFAFQVTNLCKLGRYNVQILINLIFKKLKFSTIVPGN